MVRKGALGGNADGLEHQHGDGDLGSTDPGPLPEGDGAAGGAEPEKDARAKPGRKPTPEGEMRIAIPIHKELVDEIHEEALALNTTPKRILDWLASEAAVHAASYTGKLGESYLEYLAGQRRLVKAGQTPGANPDLIP